MTTEQLEQIFNDNTTEGYWRVGTKVMTLPKFIEVVSKILDEKTELRNDKDGNIEVPDLTELTEIEKEEFINGFGQTAVEGFMRIFYAFKLNTHIDYSCVEDNTGDKFTLQFRKVNYTESEYNEYIKQSNPPK